jgi:hypothetical protein
MEVVWHRRCWNWFTLPEEAGRHNDPFSRTLQPAWQERLQQFRWQYFFPGRRQCKFVFSLLSESKLMRSSSCLRVCVYPAIADRQRGLLFDEKRDRPISVGALTAERLTSFSSLSDGDNIVCFEHLPNVVFRLTAVLDLFLNTLSFSRSQEEVRRLGRSKLFRDSPLLKETLDPFQNPVRYVTCRSSLFRIIEYQFPVVQLIHRFLENV